MHFNLVKSKSYNSSLDGIIYIDLFGSINDKKLNISNYIFQTLKILSKDFNVFVFSLGSSDRNTKVISKMYGEHINFVYFSDNGIKFNSKRDYKTSGKDPEQAPIDNYEIVKNILNLEIGFVGKVKGVLIQPPALVDDCDFDHIKSGFETNEYKAMIKKFNDGIESGNIFRYTAFITKPIRIMMDTIEFFIERDGSQVYQFIIDPSQYYKYFEDVHGAKTFCFNDDFRGSRKFHEFPIGQLNYFLDSKIEAKPFNEKEKVFIWGGVALTYRGDRMEDYLRFLDGFEYENSQFHIANGNGIFTKENPNHPQQLLNHPLFEEVNKSIKESKINLGILSNEAFEELLKDFMFTLIFKSITKNDSLNFRIYYSLLYNMIPLIADNYDPANLQIDSKFNDSLIVKNKEDLINFIDFYLEKSSSAEILLKDLQDHYMKPHYFTKDWYEKSFRENYFKELH